MTNADLAAIQADGAKLLSGDQSLIEYLMAHNGIKVYTSGNPITSNELVNELNRSTPTFFGGAFLDYSPVDKLNLTSMAYFYSNQTIKTNQVDVSNSLNAADMYKVEPKIIIDAKLSYKFWNDNKIFINARNLFNNQKKEFSYTDRIGGTYLVGLSLNFH
jgi:outer membrane receptor for ferrienterochelin and colicin